MLYATREQKKWAAKRRAEFALKVALDRIDYLEDVIKPELEALGGGRAQLVSTGDSAADAAEGLKGILELEQA